MSDEQPIHKKRRKLRGYHVLILALLAGIGWFGLYRWRLKSRLQARMDAIRAAGYPVNLVELDEWYSIPNGVDNAADVILDAISYYQEPQEKELQEMVMFWELPGRREELSAERKSLIDQFLAENQKAIEMIHQATAIEYSRYPVDLRKGIDALLPHLSTIRSITWLLSQQAISHAENNDTSRAVECVASIIRVANSMSEEPVLVSQNSRMYSLEFAASCIERVINRAEFTEGQLVKLTDVVLRHVASSGFVRGFAGERCLVLGFFSEPELLDPEAFDRAIPSVPVLQLYRFIGLMDKAAIAYLNLMDTYAKAIELPEDERLEAIKALDDKLESGSMFLAFLDQFVITYSWSTGIHLRTTAHMRVTYAGLAIERYRLAVGKLPGTLSELLPGYLDTVPRDPFDGAEMRYRRLEKGYVVYSIGEDGSDDGGRERLRHDERKDPEENWDVTFIVER